MLKLTLTLMEPGEEEEKSLDFIAIMSPYLLINCLHSNYSELMESTNILTKFRKKHFIDDI